MAAGISTLEELRDQNPYDKFNAQASIIEKALLDAAAENGVIEGERMNDEINRRNVVF